MERLSDYNYSLPKSLIARHPQPRGSAKLLCLFKNQESCTHDHFFNIGNYLRAGDTLLVNNTKVMKARIFCRKQSGGKAEILLAEKEGKNFRALIKGGGSLIPGKFLLAGQGAKTVKIKVEEQNKNSGLFEISSDEDLIEVSERLGQIPLPPYLERQAIKQDEVDYQTIFARQDTLGAVAAPTAGLHFTENVLDQLKNKGVNIAQATLNVGPGTFLPVRCENIDHHKMHSEFFTIDQQAAQKLNQCVDDGGRIVAVGTTSLRMLEQAMTWAYAKKSRRFEQISGHTSLFVRPGYKFLATDALITNFHLPKSTLLMLVSAVSGKDRILKAYAEAVKNNYRFFSYGDACFLEMQGKKSG